jgi:hypothetical protein
MRLRIYRGGKWAGAALLREVDSAFAPCQDQTVTLVDDEGTTDYGVVDVRWSIGLQGAPADFEDSVDVLIDIS